MGIYAKSKHWKKVDREPQTGDIESVNRVNPEVPAQIYYHLSAANHREHRQGYLVRAQRSLTQKSDYRCLALWKAAAFASVPL